MGWCHDCVGISSSLQHKELELTKTTTALFAVLLLICQRKQGEWASTPYSNGCVIIDAAQGAAPHPRAADGCNKEKTFWLLFSYSRSTVLQNH